MEIGELIYIGFCSLAVINALFFAFYVWIRQNRNSYATALLALFLIIMAFRILQMLLHDLQDDFNLGINIKTFFFFIPVFPLLGPLLLQYIKSVSIRNFTLIPRDLFHLLPFTVILILDLINRKNFPLSPANASHYLTYSIEISVILLQFLIYLFIAFRYTGRLIRFNAADKLQKDHIDPYYIRNIVLLISFSWIIYAMYCAQTIFQFYFPTRVIEAVYYSVLSYLILYYEMTGQRITAFNNFTTRYRSSVLTMEDSLKYKTMILEYITGNQSYKDTDITLGKLSKNLSLTPHVLSRVINEQLGCNFNDFINSYRVDEAKKMLSDPRKNNITIAGIAYDCGFNTLSAFNTAFKKFTGLTPSQFRKK